MHSLVRYTFERTLRNLRLILSILLGITSLSLWPEAVDFAQSAPPTVAGFDLTNAERATVSITQISHTSDGQPVIDCVGSGTLVSPDGLILTNAHFARPSARCPAESIVIGLAVEPGEAPVATYYADPVEVNVGWDLAVLRITRTLDGRPIDPSSLALPFVALGDSDALNLDNTITALGYSVGANATGSAVVTRGTIGNFLDESLVGNNAWIVINATPGLPGGLSGGGAYNEQGQLIGVPTIEPAPDQPQACRSIQDTNGDGRVDSRDACVPLGGTITELRPSRLARGLVRAAQLGVSVVNSQDNGQSGGQLMANTSAGTSTFTRLLFAPGVNAAGMPTTIITSAPSGIKSLYLFFDYAGMNDSVIYELRTTIDGVPNAAFSLSPGAWSGGQSGMWYVGSHSQVWPNGTYIFALLINGERVASQQFVVGGPAQSSPTFSDLLFGVPGERNQLVLTGDVLAAQGSIAAQFAYNNIPSKMMWHQVWYYANQPIARTDDQPWSDGTNGTKQISAAAQTALSPGRYRLELYLNGQLATTADFVMAGVQQAGQVQVFNKVAFGTGVSGNAPTGTNAVFANTTTQLYATFTAQNLAPGTPWTWRWSVDGNPLFEETTLWSPTGGQPFTWLRLDSTNRLPDGSYTIELLVGGVSMGQAMAKVGLGQLPLGLFVQPIGVQVQGQVVDAETGQPIEGAAVVVLISSEATTDYSGQMTDVDELLLTDSKGQFQLTHLLARGNSYSVLIRANGYLPMATDALTVDDKTPNPLVVTVRMSRD